jgi:hypothetical protein
MKKIFLFGALAVATLANAVDFQTPQKINFASDAKKIETTPSAFEWKDAKTFMKEHDGVRAAQAADYDAADWYDVPGALHLGIYEGLSGYSVAIIHVPFMDSIEFINYYGPTSWSWNGELDLEDSEREVIPGEVGGTYYTPETSDHLFNPAQDWGQGKDTTFHLKGTQYGNGVNYQYVLCATESKWLNEENSYMTLCAMETDIWNEPDYDGSDFWMVGAASLGDVYYNGTGVHLVKGEEATADTIGIIVDNRGTMKIERILFPIYNDGRADAVNKYIPDGAELRVAIFPWDENGIHFEDTLASTVMTNGDFVSAGEGYEWVGTLIAKFYETDIFGEVTETPIWVDGNFYLQLTNFNETGCDFGIYSDYHCPVTGTTVYQHDGEFSYRGGKGGGGSYGQNLGISFDAYWPTLANDTNVYELHAGAEEGWAYFGEDPEDNGILLWTNVDPNEWEVESDVEWISYDFSDEYFADYYAGVIAFYVEALPEGETGRRATVSVFADGAVQEFTIIQGVDPQGLENVNFQNNNKKYNVLGVEVDNNFKGVVISNGKKAIVR